MSQAAADRFLEACGATGPLCVEVDGPDGAPVERYILPRPYVLIGRDPAVDIRLDHPEVSRRHTYLQVVGGHVLGIDLESRTGTHTDRGEPLGWLGPMQPFRIGPFRLRAWIGARPDCSSSSDPDRIQEPSPLTSAYARRHHLPGATLAIRNGPDAPITCPVDRAVTLLGGSSRCRIRIRTRGPDASRFYAALIRGPHATWVVDLRSHAGIQVNGRAVEHAHLGPTDELQVGRYRLTLDPATEGRLPLSQATEPVPGTALARHHAPCPAENLPAGRSAWEDPALAGFDLAGQGGAMPDQFQQSLLILSRMIGTMHQDHMEAVREELALIRQIAQELKALREAPAPGTPNSPAPGEAPAPAAAGLPAPDEPPPRIRLAPEEIDAVVSRRLAAYANEPSSPWDRILKLVQSGQ